MKKQNRIDFYSAGTTFESPVSRWTEGRALAAAVFHKLCKDVLKITDKQEMIRELKGWVKSGWSDIVSECSGISREEQLRTLAAIYRDKKKYRKKVGIKLNLTYETNNASIKN